MKARYEDYKDSEVAWIGQIPAGWEVRRLKRVCQIYGRIGFRGYNQSDLVGKGDGAITLSPSNMKDGKMDYAKCSYLSWEKYYESPEIMIENGDILFVKTGSTYGKVAFVSDLPMEATINPQIVVLKSINCDTTFFKYVLSSELIQNQVNTSVIGGTIPTISQEKILSYKIPLPPLPEQCSIAAYLDQRCAAIDEYTASLQREAALARELKRALIAQAVTRGLDTSAPMKDSGVAWIGQVPAGWEVSTVSRYYDVQLGKMLQPNKESDSDTYEYYLCAANLGKNTLKLDNVKQMWLSEKDKELYSVAVGDLLVVEGGDVGSCAVVEKDLGNIYIQNALHRVRPKAGNDIRFLRYWLMNAKSIGYIDLICNKATIAHFTKDKLASFPIPLPPLPEQRAIAAYLDQRCRNIDEYTESLEREAALAREMKQREVADAVTGKVRV